jgi:hypothetical protein
MVAAGAFARFMISGRSFNSCGDLNQLADEDTGFSSLTDCADRGTR